MSIQVQTKTVPVQKLISMTRNTYIRDLQAHLDGSIQSLIIYAQTVRAEITGLPFAIYHGTPRAEQSGLIEICLPVTGDIPATIEITVKTLPARQVAYTVATLQQSIYPGLLKIHAALEEWINSNGHQRAEPPREIFLNFNNSIFSATAALDDQCIEAMWPYQ